MEDFRPNDADDIIQEIMAISDFAEAFDIADKLELSLGGLEDIDEMKERLKMDVEKCQPDFINFKEKTCREMKDIRRDDNSKREKILDLLEKTKSKLLRDGEESSREVVVIEDALKTENKVTSLKKDFNIRQESMNTKECKFVVAGETSAGKSLFLNSLLGEDILPSRLQPCTSVITRLTYDKKRHAKIVFHDPDRLPLLYSDVTTEDMRTLIFEENIEKREKTSDIKEVQIFLPSRVLESGLVLIDSPGIGENEDMDTVIEQFVDDNQIMGFIYIIKSDNGGGMDEDRLVKLMKIILQKEKSKGEMGSYRFDPSCAMFICNIWDRVDDKDLVYNFIKQRLSSMWPQFDEKKLITFSTQRAIEETKMDPDYITEDFKRVLHVLREIYSESLDERIKVSYNWIKTVLIRSIHHLRTIVRQLNCSHDKSIANKKNAVKNLTELKHKTTDVITALRKLIVETTDKICCEFRNHLKLPVVKMAISQWIQVELPTAVTSDGKQKDWDSLKCEIDGLIYDRIGEELNKWEDENGIIGQFESFAVSEISDKLHSLSDVVKELEEELVGTQKRRRPSVIYTEVPIRSQPRRESFAFASIKSLENPLHLSVHARNKIFKPWRTVMKKLPGGNKLKIYKDNPVAYASKRSDKLLTKFLEPISYEEDPLKNVIDYFMEGAKEFLNKLVLKIPSSIDANSAVLTNVESFQRDSAQSRRIWEEMMKDMEILKHMLGEYGSGYIFVDDFKPDELQVLDPNDASGRSSLPFRVLEFLTSLSSSQTTTVKQFPRGLWTAHQKGLLKNENGDNSVSIKIYLPSCKLDSCCKEIAKLRLLEHKHIADFRGIQNSDNYLPAMVYQQHLKTLGQYSLKRSRKIDAPCLLEECGSALEYLHRHGMVHMELNMNTIMVTSSGSVCLTGGCLPRKADLPENPENHTSGDFVYLSPEVLRGDLYTATADVYAFGLLIYELVSKAHAFTKNNKMSLDLFIQTFDPIKMLGKDLESLNLTEEVKALILSCVKIYEGSRPSMLNLREKIAQMSENNVFDEIKSVPSSGPEIHVRRFDYGRV